ncbi:2597_t:CDS:2 [Funneliformis geosporum]|nr:2597_t:CDS:2 [Funneliformis geosporum]
MVNDPDANVVRTFLIFSKSLRFSEISYCKVSIIILYFNCSSTDLDVKAEAALDVEVEAVLDVNTEVALDVDVKVTLDVNTKAALDVDAEATLDVNTEAALDVDVNVKATLDVDRASDDIFFIIDTLFYFTICYDDIRERDDGVDEDDDIYEDDDYVCEEDGIYEGDNDVHEDEDENKDDIYDGSNINNSDIDDVEEASEARSHNYNLYFPEQTEQVTLIDTRTNSSQSLPSFPDTAYNEYGAYLEEKISLETKINSDTQMSSRSA